MTASAAPAGNPPLLSAGPGTATQRDIRFFRNLLTVMAAVLVSGFVVQLAAGRSSFSAPLVVHLHAVAFMGWVAIVVGQTWLAAGGSIAQHRRLGMLAVLWAVALLVLGPLVTAEAVRTGRTPFFFQPQHFVLVNSLGMVAYIGLFAAAVAMRKHSAWHTRLHVAGFAFLLGPGFGRLLPSPLLMPYAFEISAAAGVIFVFVAMARDWRALGRVHAAWWIALALMVVWLGAARLAAFSPVGDALYAALIADTPMAGTDGRAFPPPPPMAP